MEALRKRAFRDKAGACHTKYSENQLRRGVSNGGMLLDETCFYSEVLHAYFVLEHANADKKGSQCQGKH